STCAAIPHKPFSTSSASRPTPPTCSNGPKKPYSRNLGAVQPPRTSTNPCSSKTSSGKPTSASKPEKNPSTSATSVPSGTTSKTPWTASEPPAKATVTPLSPTCLSLWCALASSNTATSALKTTTKATAG